MITCSPEPRHSTLSTIGCGPVASYKREREISPSLVLRLLFSGCLLVCLSGVLTGCITVQERPGQTSQPAVLPQDDSADAVAKQELEARQARLREDADRRRQQAIEENAGESAPAVVALRSKAENESKSGNVQTANLLLERALRIDPADASTYLQLAQLRLDNQEYRQAAALARRGLSLNPPADVASDLERLIEQAENPPALKTEA